MPKTSNSSACRPGGRWPGCRSRRHANCGARPPPAARFPRYPGRRWRGGCAGRASTIGGPGRVCLCGSGRTPGTRCISGWPGWSRSRRASSRWRVRRAGRCPVGREAGVDGRQTELLLLPHRVDRRDDRGALLVQHQQGFGAALGRLGRGRVRDLLRQVPVQDFAEVVTLGGVGPHPAPHFLLQRQPEVFGDVLLGAPQKDGGRIGAVQVDRLIGGEQVTGYTSSR
jgi:hypothetical protein